MSIVGNFLFTPILTIFLILSSLIFITELLAIPNGILIYLLSSTVTLWESTLSTGKKLWLVGFGQPTKILAFLCIILAAAVTLRFIFNVISKVILASIVMIISSFCYNYYFKWPNKIKSEFVPNSSKKLVVNQNPNKTISITDNGFFNKKQSPKNFVSFELKPYLIKKYGLRTIEKVVLNEPSERSLQAVEELRSTFTVKNLIRTRANR